MSGLRLITPFWIELASSRLSTLLLIRIIASRSSSEM
jgi:hypothetical protein